MAAPLIAIIAGVAMLALGLVAGYFYQVWLSGSRMRVLAQRVEEELKAAEAQQRALIETTTRNARQAWEAGERELADRRREMQRHEQRAQQRDERLEARAEALEERERASLAREADLDAAGRQLEADAQAQEAARQEHVAALEREPYAPPTEIAIDAALVGVLAERGSVVRVNDSIVFAAGAYREIVDRIVTHLREHGAITVADVRDAFGTSRKYALPLLEHLDQLHVTRRQGDQRVLLRDPRRS